jgi:hypothetical protein
MRSITRSNFPCKSAGERNSLGKDDRSISEQFDRQAMAGTGLYGRALLVFGIICGVSGMLISFVMAGMFCNTAVAVVSGIMLLGLCAYWIAVGVIGMRNGREVKLVNVTSLTVGGWAFLSAILGFARTAAKWPKVPRFGQFCYAFFISGGFFLGFAGFWNPICKTVFPDVLPTLPGQDKYQWVIIYGASACCAFLAGLCFILPKGGKIQGYEADLAIVATISTVIDWIFGALAGGFLQLTINRAGYEQDTSRAGRTGTA